MRGEGIISIIINNTNGIIDIIICANNNDNSNKNKNSKIQWMS